jgi:cystathionine beta-lyase/cystathionine gamma-synthase
MRPDSRIVHAGRELGPRDPLAPPIAPASVYVYQDLEDYDAVAAGRRPGFYYARNGTPNAAMLEAAVAELEGAEAGLATASGMAAIAVALTALVPRPAPVVVAAEAYGATLALLREDLAPLGYQVRAVDPLDAEAVERELAGAGVLVLETITNPLCRVPDLELLCRLAREHGVPCLVDNTFASPALCRPLELGATAVVHSVTKYLGGHSDLCAGVLVGDRELVARARARLVRSGGIVGTFDAWLALRGLRTLHLRMRRHSETALCAARRLASLPQVARVYHPRLVSAEVAERILPQGTGGMFAFDLAGGRPAVQRMLERFRLVRFAASLGGVETTVSHPEITSHRGLDPEERLARGITPGTVRVSAGLEDPEDVAEDFAQAVA